MLNKIIQYSLHNRLLVMIAAVALLIWGSITAHNMEVDVFPDLNAPTVVVMTEAQGMAPEEVERLVTFPVETAVNGATDVRRVRSSSTTGFSVVWVEFEWGTNIYTARQIVSEKLATLGEALPDNVGTPTLGPQSSILGEMMIIGLTADSTSLQDLRTIADWTIRPRLLSTGGVAQVAVIGGDIKEYQILLDPARMKYYNIGLDEVLPVVENMNQNATGGILYEYGNEYIIQGVMATTRVEEIGKAVIKTVDDFPITLADIANVQIGAKTPKLGVASEKGKPAVLVTVTKQPGTNTLELTDKLDASIQELRKTLPEDVEVSTDIFRQSRFINSSIHNIQEALLEGAVFVIVVLFFFLMNFRTTIISLVALPLSMLMAILVMHALGLTINTMSLGGLAIAIGSLVDDAIVDVENVTLTRKPIQTRHRTTPDHRNCFRRFERSPDAYPELYVDHRGLFSSFIFPFGHGRQNADTAGYCFRCRPVCFDRHRFDTDSGIMQLYADYRKSIEKKRKGAIYLPQLKKGIPKIVKLGTALQKNSDRYSCHPTGFIADHPIQFRT